MTKKKVEKKKSNEKYTKEENWWIPLNLGGHNMSYYQTDNEFICKIFEGKIEG